MAKILIVHGIGNQFGGEAELHAVWYPALCDAMHRAGLPPPEPGDCFCPFYGDLFRPSEHLGAIGQVGEEDVTNASEDESLLLEAIWRSAVADDQDIPSPEDFSDTLIYAPAIVERALNSLAKSKYMLPVIDPLLFFGDLKQVIAYLKDDRVRTQARSRVANHIGSDTKIVIGHSLGSVIAYETLFQRPEQVLAFISIGSPLGIRNVVFDRLDPPPMAGIGRWPGRIEYWTNIAARGDIVAAQKELAPLFGRVTDVLINSGWDAHSSARYLNTAEAGEAIARALTGHGRSSRSSAIA